MNKDEFRSAVSGWFFKDLSKLLPTTAVATKSGLALEIGGQRFEYGSYYELDWDFYAFAEAQQKWEGLTNPSKNARA